MLARIEPQPPGVVVAAGHSGRAICCLSVAVRVPVLSFPQLRITPFTVSVLMVWIKPCGVSAANPTFLG